VSGIKGVHPRFLGFQSKVGCACVQQICRVSRVLVGRPNPGSVLDTTINLQRRGGIWEPSFPGFVSVWGCFVLHDHTTINLQRRGGIWEPGFLGFGSYLLCDAGSEGQIRVPFWTQQSTSRGEEASGNLVSQVSFLFGGALCCTITQQLTSRGEVGGIWEPGFLGFGSYLLCDAVGLFLLVKLVCFLTQFPGSKIIFV
jgi:hypothetical protein